MKEIGLGKELGDSPQQNVVKFIGCVTTQSKKPYSLHPFMPFIRDLHLFFFFSLSVCLGKNK